MSDKTPRNRLVLIVIAGVCFVGSLIAVFWLSYLGKDASDAMMLLLGSSATIFGTVINYYFGNSEAPERRETPKE